MHGAGNRSTRIGLPYRVAFAAMLVPSLGAATARGELEGLARLIPADALAGYAVNVPGDQPGQAAPNSFETLTTLIDQAFAMGFLRTLSIEVRGWLDALASVSTIIRYPHAVALFDLQVEREPDDSHRVSMLRAALVLKTAGDHKPVERRIQHLLESYTNQSESTLVVKPVGAHTMHRLKDHRLADWVDLCWGPVGDSFVVAIGAESFQAVIDAVESRSDSVWHRKFFRDGASALAADSALVVAFLDFETVRKRSSPMGRKIGRMQADLTMGDCAQAVWAAGYDGPSLEIRQWLVGAGPGRVSLISGRRFLPEHRTNMFPEQAATYAAFGVEPDVWFRRIRAAFLSARSQRNAARWRADWTRIEQEAGLQFEKIFAQIDGPIVVHDFPRHALRLPPAWTIVAPVGDSEAVRRDVDRLLSYWQRQLVERAAALRLEKSEDNIWYMKVGIEGPAAAVTDHFLVISFSPHAVRQNLELLKRDSQAQK